MGGLRQYLVSVEDVPFRWADHNCMTFTSGALVAQGLDPLPHDWCDSGGSPMAAARAYRRRLARYGKGSIIEGMDDRYDRVHTLHPVDGMICARRSDRVLGYSFGVTFMGLCVHVGDFGLVTSEPEIEDIFWSAE